MPYLNFSSAKPTFKLFIILFSIITIGIITFFAGLLIARVIFWLHLDQVNDILYGRYELLTDRQLKYFQIIQSIGFFILPGFFLRWLFSSPEKEYFNISIRFRAVPIILLIGIFLFAMPIINWLVEINQRVSFPEIFNNVETQLRQMENSYSDYAERLLYTENFAQFLLNILMIAIIPAIGEELIFRGIIQKLFIEISNNVHLSILITAFLFSAVHGQFFGFAPRFVLGLFLGYLMVWNKSIWLPVFAHFTNNAIAVTAYYLHNAGKLNSLPENIGLAEGKIFIVPLSILITVVLILLLRKSITKNSIAYDDSNS